MLSIKNGNFVVKGILVSNPKFDLKKYQGELTDSKQNTELQEYDDAFGDFFYQRNETTESR